MLRFYLDTYDELEIRSKQFCKYVSYLNTQNWRILTPLSSSLTSINNVINKIN